MTLETFIRYGTFSVIAIALVSGAFILTRLFAAPSSSLSPVLGGKLDGYVTDQNYPLIAAEHTSQRLQLRAGTDTASRDKQLPTDLYLFSWSVRNGDPEALRGVYVAGLFALPVLEQPEHNPEFVSVKDAILTQFRPADQYGNVGLLAHNYLSGALFFKLVRGQPVVLVYGDGHLEYFKISDEYRYEALSPKSPYSDFIDLKTDQYLKASVLFGKMYKGKRHITFQTCIARWLEPSWGRLFVLAVPDEEK